MNVTCPDCRTVYRVDPRKIAVGGVLARCARCPATFQIDAPSESADERFAEATSGAESTFLHGGVAVDAGAGIERHDEPESDFTVEHFAATAESSYEAQESTDSSAVDESAEDDREDIQRFDVPHAEAWGQAHVEIESAEVSPVDGEHAPSLEVIGYEDELTESYERPGAEEPVAEVGGDEYGEPMAGIGADPYGEPVAETEAEEYGEPVAGADAGADGEPVDDGYDEDEVEVAGATDRPVEEEPAYAETDGGGWDQANRSEDDAMEGVGSEDRYAHTASGEDQYGEPQPDARPEKEDIEEPSVVPATSADFDGAESPDEHDSAYSGYEPGQDIETSEDDHAAVPAGVRMEEAGLDEAAMAEEGFSTVPRRTDEKISLPPAPFGSTDPHARARRLARALVSDIVVYNPDRRDRSVREGTVRQEFREEIRKSWEEYVAQVGNQMARETAYFRDALNELLAGGSRLF